MTKKHHFLGCLFSSRVSALVAEMKVLEAFFSEETKTTEAKAPAPVAQEAPLKKAKLGTEAGRRIEGSYLCHFVPILQSSLQPKSLQGFACGK